MSRLIREATIRCPAGGFEKEDTMPLNACVVLYECNRCHPVLVRE